MAYRKQKLLVTIPILAFLIPFQLAIKGILHIFEFLDNKLDDLAEALDIWAGSN